jgi:hypothetical protein
MRKLRRTHQFNHTFEPFTDAMTKDSILRSSNSTVVGLDGLKFLGPIRISNLTRLFNLSLAHADIPAVWKRANIIPIPKLGKPVNNSTSYRPIYLLSPCIKVLEHLCY